MTINYQFGYMTAQLTAHDATIRAGAGRRRPSIEPLSATCRPLVTFGAATGLVTCHGQKAQIAGGNMASTDSAVGSTWS